MASKEEGPPEQASDQTDVSADVVHKPPILGNSSHGNASDNPVSVLVELLRQVPALSSEEPEAILGLVSKIDEIHALGLVDDKMFVVRVLPKVSSAVLRFFRDLRNGKNWGQCKSELVKEFFPLFIRERLIRDLIIFNFHDEDQALREYADQVFAASKILKYGAGRNN